MNLKIVLIFLLMYAGAAMADQTKTWGDALGSEIQPEWDTPEHRAFDFWVGEWDLSWKQADGSLAAGSNIITKTPYGNCVVTEQFDGAPSMDFKGMSVSTFHKQTGLWRQAWVDGAGGFFSLYGGPQSDGTFLLEMERLNDQGPYRRMIWKNIEQDSLDWHWQGRESSEEVWGDLWVIHYKKR